MRFVSCLAGSVSLFFLVSASLHAQLGEWTQAASVALWGLANMVAAIIALLLDISYRLDKK